MFKVIMAEGAEEKEVNRDTTTELSICCSVSIFTRSPIPYWVEYLKWNEPIEDDGFHFVRAVYSPSIQKPWGYIKATNILEVL